MLTQFEHNWMVEIGPRYRRLSDGERAENPLPAIVDPPGVQQFIERLHTQEKRLGRFFRRSSQEPLPLKWERIYAQQIYDAEERVRLKYKRSINFWLFRKRLRKWFRRLVFLLCLVTGVQVFEPNLEMLYRIDLITTAAALNPEKAVATMNQALPEIKQGVVGLFKDRIELWMALFCVYFLSYFFRPSARPGGGNRKITNRVRHLLPDGIMLKSGQLVQWDGLQVVKDVPEIFEIRLRNAKNYQVMLHVDCTVEQYIPIYLYVKKCLSKS